MTSCRLFRGVPVTFALALLASCDFDYGPVTREWTEDVLLDDGKTIQVKRSVTFKESNSMSGDAYNAEEWGATIAFTGELAQLPTWDWPLMAMVLYRDAQTNEWVIVARTASCEVWERRGRPKPPYWEFRLGASGWYEVPLSANSFGRPANLLRRYHVELSSDRITVEERRRMEAGRMNRAYREVWGDPDQYVCGEGVPGRQ